MFLHLFNKYTKEWVHLNINDLAYLQISMSLCHDGTVGHHIATDITYAYLSFYKIKSNKSEFISSVNFIDYMKDLDNMLKDFKRYESEVSEGKEYDGKEVIYYRLDKVKNVRVSNTNHCYIATQSKDIDSVIERPIGPYSNMCTFVKQLIRRMELNRL